MDSPSTRSVLLTIWRSAGAAALILGCIFEAFEIPDNEATAALKEGGLRMMQGLWPVAQ